MKPMSLPLPLFLPYLLLGLLILALAMALHLWVTPFAELRLIREGNTAAALVFSGHLLGFALPVAAVIADSVSLLDVSLWAVTAVLVQSLAHGVVRGLMPGFVATVREGGIAAGVLSAGVSVALGLINAASLSG